ncbi:hypothetical protein UYSO10_1367 [Kosakonia radicincitans]|nr:hypothetical protein UYSO10_1367 [Kosakonia radicincitans]
MPGFDANIMQKRKHFICSALQMNSLRVSGGSVVGKGKKRMGNPSALTVPI